MIFLFILASSTFWAIKSFKTITQPDQLDQHLNLFKHRRKLNFTITVLFIAQILLILLSVHIGFKVFCPFCFRAVDENDTNLQDIGKIIEKNLKFILRDDIADDLAAIVRLVLKIIDRIELPKVEVDFDEILQKILTESAFYQTSTVLRVFKILLVYFGALLNLIIGGTIYHLLEYSKQLLNLIREDSLSFDNPDLYRDKIVALKSGSYHNNNNNEPSSEDAELKLLSHQNHVNNNPIHANTSTNNYSNYNNYNSSPLTQSTPMTSPENIGGIIDSNFPDNDRTTAQFNTKGVIELPFIGKSSDNINAANNILKHVNPRRQTTHKIQH